MNNFYTTRLAGMIKKHSCGCPAYNTPDLYRKRETTLDDNVAMLQAYGVFLADINKLLPSEIDEESKVESLKESMKKVFGILLYGDRSKYINEDFNIKFGMPLKCIYKYKEVYNFHLEDKEISTSNKINFHIKSISADISISLSAQNKITFFNFNKGCKNENILYNLSKSLLHSYKENNLLQIFKLTSDFMYSHISHNANGRASQILRDCFSLMLNQAPMPALTNLSHYIYFNSNVDEEHLIFMQALFYKKLHSIKYFNVKELTEKKQTNQLIKKFQKNKAILTDVKHYKHLATRNIFCCLLQ